MVPVKRHLLVLVLGALLPLLALAVALTVLLVREDRERAEQGLHENARLLAENERLVRELARAQERVSFAEAELRGRGLELREVEGELEVGEPVVVRGNERLQPGAPVRVVEARKDRPADGPGAPRGPPGKAGSP